MSRNTDTVQSIYQAFGQGDLPAILARLSPDVRWEAWEDHSAQRSGHPLYAARTGPQDVTGFFEVLGKHLTIHEFRVLDVFGEGRQVAAEIQLEATWLPTGRRLRDEEMHLWTFDEEGRVMRFRHYVDTAKHMHAAGLLPSVPTQAEPAAR